MKNISLIRTLLLFYIISIISINSFGQTTNQNSNFTFVSSWNAGANLIYDGKLLYTFTYPTHLTNLETYEEFIKLVNDTIKYDKIRFNQYNLCVGLLMDEPEQLNDSLSRRFVWVYSLKNAPLNEKKMKSNNKICSPIYSKKCFILDECCEKDFLFSDEMDRIQSTIYYKFNKIEEIEEISIEKKAYDDKIKVINFKNQTVLELLKVSIANNQLTDSNSKKGAVIPNLLEGTGFNFKGVIKPEIEGVLQVYDSKDRFDYAHLKMEYVINKSKITSLKIILWRAEGTNKTLGDIVIDFSDTLKIKSIDYNTFSKDHSGWELLRSNSLIFEEKKVKNSDTLLSFLLELKNIKTHMGLNSSNSNCVDWYDNYVSPIALLYSSSSYTANIIKSNRSSVINDQNINDVLKRKSWTTYSNNNNFELPYNYSNITVNDSSFVIERITDIENKKYMEIYILDRMSYIKNIYKDGEWDSSYSEHMILSRLNEQSYMKSPSYAINNPIIMKWKREDNENIHVDFHIDGKKLLEGNVDNNGNLKGWCNYYAVNVKQYNKRYYDNLKPQTINGVLFSSNQLKSLTTFKYCLSAMDVANSYNKENYNVNYNLKFWDPKPFESIYLGIYPDFSPLAVSPLGKFYTPLKLFVDKTEDYLSQRAFFSTVGTSEYKGEKYGTLKVLYQYLPNGQVYDSVNTNKNEFGEQLGKSNLKPFPLGKDYMVLMKKEQNDSEEWKYKMMQAMIKGLNICDHCSGVIITSKKIRTTEFKCPNGKNYLLNDILGRIFCSPKCYSEYQKAWCDMQ